MDDLVTEPLEDGSASDVPVHRRTMEIAVYDGPGGMLRVVGTLRDTRPWAVADGDPGAALRRGAPS